MKKFVAILLLASFSVAVCLSAPHYSKSDTITSVIEKKNSNELVFINDAQIIEIPTAPIVLHAENVEKPIALFKSVLPQTNSPPGKKV